MTTPDSMPASDSPEPEWVPFVIFPQAAARGPRLELAVFPGSVAPADSAADGGSAEHEDVALSAGEPFVWIEDRGATESILLGRVAVPGPDDSASVLQHVAMKVTRNEFRDIPQDGVGRWISNAEIEAAFDRQSDALVGSQDVGGAGTEEGQGGFVHQAKQLVALGRR